jgi:hypothetical protein
MRIASFTIGKATECFVTVLSGSGGGVAANLSRWREQLGREPLGDGELAALPTLPMLGGKATRIRIEGRYRGMRGESIDEAVLLGAVRSLAKETVFVKMIGPKLEMADQDARFDAFCRSLR